MVSLLEKTKRTSKKTRTTPEKSKVISVNGLLALHLLFLLHYLVSY